MAIVASGSRNTRFQAARYGLTWAGLSPADRASFLAHAHPGYKKEGNIERAIAGEPIGTMVTDEPGSAPAGLAETAYKATPKGLEP